jgi:hypothetical protein
MLSKQRQTIKTKIVYAPLPTDLDIIPSIISIEIQEEYDIQWFWTDLPNGNRVVTNYKIIKS